LLRLRLFVVGAAIEGQRERADRIAAIEHSFPASMTTPSA
jgi:hypothetical protein